MGQPDHQQEQQQEGQRGSTNFVGSDSSSTFAAATPAASAIVDAWWPASWESGVPSLVSPSRQQKLPAPREALLGRIVHPRCRLYRASASHPAFH